MSEVVLLHNSKTEYFAAGIMSELTDLGIKVTPLSVIRRQFSNGEHYYRLDIQSQLSLVGKTAVYVGALIDDDDFLDITRIGATLALAGLSRRIFVIPFFGYQTMDRATLPGEVVTAKTNSQMLGGIGSSNHEGNVFMFIDLHYACILHYFEGPCLRIELHAQNAMLQTLRELDFDFGNVIFGSTNLRHTALVDSYAKALDCPISFIREKYNPTKENEIDFHNEPEDIIGNVEGYHVIIYDDIIRSGRTVINAAKMYLSAGAVSVDVVASHLTCYNEQNVNDLINSPIRRIITTNTHPITQSSIVKNNDKFIVVDVSNIFLQCLYEILPAPEHKYRFSI